MRKIMQLSLSVAGGAMIGHVAAHNLDFAIFTVGLYCFVAGVLWAAMTNEKEKHG